MKRFFNDNNNNDVDDLNQVGVKKKQKTNIPQSVRKRIWELYIGIGVKETTCPLCGFNKIYGITTAGFQACHIVADGYCNKKKDLNEFDLYPGCQSCNNECADLCIFDYLYGRQRIKQLRDMIWAIYKCFSVQHQDELSYYEGMCWKVIQYLYGKQRYLAGGGIANEKQIYEIARSIQYEDLLQQSQAKAIELKVLSEQMDLLLGCEIKPMTLQ